MSEPKSDLISRSVVLSELSERQGWQDEKEACIFKEGFDCGLEAAIEDVTNAPTISAVPVVRGEWTPAKDPYDRVYCYRHAGCGCEHNEQSAFCPACGAKMEDKS